MRREDPFWQRIPRDLFVAEHRGRYILHAPLHATTCLINHSMFTQILSARAGRSNASETLLAELARWDLLEPRSAEAISSSTVTHPCEISLLLTERCNLRCTYCYARGGDGAQTLPFAAAVAGIDWIVGNAVETGSPRVTVHLHGGGELTLVWGLVQRIVTYAHTLATRHDLQLRLTAGTNGVMSTARAHELAEMVDEATISVDGLPAVHNRQRPTTHGHQTFEQVLRTVRIFAEHGVDHGLRLTVTATSIDQLPAGVAYLIEHLPSRVLQVEPAAPLGRNSDAAQVDPHAFVERFRHANRIATAAGRELRYSGARYPHLTDVFCGAVTGAPCLTPGGRVTACYEAGEDPSGQLTFGTFDATTGRLQIDLERQRRLLRYSVHHRPECDGCIAKYHCAGDCPMKRVPVAAPGQPPPRCVVTRELTADQILAELEGTPHCSPLSADADSCRQGAP